MTSINIGVDVDNVIVNSNYEWWKWLELQTKVGIPWEQAKKFYRLADCYHEHIIKHEALDFWRSTYLYDDMAPIKNSIRVLQKFKDQGHKIVFVSTLKGNHHKSKVEFIRRYFPFYDAFLGTKEKEFVNVAMMIDDSNHVLNRFTDKNCILIKYDNDDYQVEELEKGKRQAYLCKNWEEIEYLWDIGEFEWRKS